MATKTENLFEKNFKEEERLRKLAISHPHLVTVKGETPKEALDRIDTQNIKNYSGASYFIILFVVIASFIMFLV